MFQNTFTLSKPRLAVFANIMKVVTMFRKTICKDSLNINITRNYVPKCNQYLYLLMWQNFLNSDKKNAGISRNQGVCVVTHIMFWSSLGKVQLHQVSLS